MEDIEQVVAEAGGPRPLRVEGLEKLEWVLLDYGPFVVHVFDTEQRVVLSPRTPLGRLPPRRVEGPRRLRLRERVRQTTMLTIRPGTTMTFFGVAPSSAASTLASASAAASTASVVGVGGHGDVRRAPCR